jgi:hypothetical protein
MSRAPAVFHGRFGRATVYQLNRPFNAHAHREGTSSFTSATRQRKSTSATILSLPGRQFRRLPRHANLLGCHRATRLCSSSGAACGIPAI